MLLAMPRPILTLPPAADRAELVELEVDEAPLRPRREPRPPVIAVDFDHVPASQVAMHRRLENWARSLVDRPRQAVAAGFSLYRSSDAKDVTRRAYGAPTQLVVDQADAQRIAMAIAELANDTRSDGFRRARALDWYYRQGCRDARGTADGLHFSLHGLAECVIAARAALIERAP